MNALPNLLLLASGSSLQIFEPHPAWVTAFVLLLLCIAILPLLVEHWWEHNSNKAIVAGLLSLPVAVYYLLNSPSELLHPILEYFSFIVLLWSLYTISGGIVLRGSLAGTPRVNTALLAIGAVIANIFGTTGAAMLLIRPLLRMNEKRQNKKHIVIFFIFMVANIGGCLTPLGDPPLFLGYLRGVPFTWTLSLFPVWAATVGILLALFYFWDRRAWASESSEVRTASNGNEPLSIAGSLNFLLIAGVLLATISSSQLQAIVEATGLGWPEGSPYRELIMVSMGLLSMKLTKKELREENRFSFGAIIEVAILFAGIFITMVPALALLSLHGAELGVTTPAQFFWAAGALSSFLDNAPTYLVFATAATSVAGVDGIRGLVTSPGGHVLLKAVSLGAVFMGANTYIGNAPNFMVKVIADTARERRVKMPSFFGYMLYSIGILIPVFILVTLVAFILFRSYL